MAAALLFVSLMYALCWLSFKLCKQFKISWRQLAAHPGELVTDGVLVATVVGFAIIYSVSADLWEWRQAYIAIYDGPPRGYIQWGQLLLDFTGALASIAITKRIIRAA